MKNPRLRTMKSSVPVEILPKDNWEEVAYMTIKGMSVQAFGLLGQMKGRRGEEKLRDAVDALEASAEEILDEEEDFLIAIGNVVVVSDSGVTLFTDTLAWDNVKENVFTDDPVKFITDSQDTLYGIGFESDVELNNWKILNPTGVFHENENEKQ